MTNVGLSVCAFGELLHNVGVQGGHANQALTKRKPITGYGSRRVRTVRPHKIDCAVSAAARFAWGQGRWG